jgi:hypothetical protein
MLRQKCSAELSLQYLPNQHLLQIEEVVVVDGLRPRGPRRLKARFAKVILSLY